MTAREHREQLRTLVEDIRYLWEDRNSRVEEVLERQASMPEVQRLRLQRDFLVLDAAFGDKVRALHALLDRLDREEAGDAGD